jgi:hypothetical protein
MIWLKEFMFWKNVTENEWSRRSTRAAVRGVPN